MRKLTSPPDQGGFSDLTEDPDLYSLVQQKVNQRLMQAKTPQEQIQMGLEWDTYKEAATEIRNKLESMYGKQRTNAQREEERQKKLDKKRKLDVVKPVNKKTEKPKEEKEPTTQDIIKEKAKMRGQEVF